jgi:hypothetical protein
VKGNKESKTNTDSTTGGRKWGREWRKNVYEKRAHPRLKRRNIRTVKTRMKKRYGYVINLKKFHRTRYEGNWRPFHN